MRRSGSRSGIWDPIFSVGIICPFGERTNIILEKNPAVTKKTFSDNRQLEVICTPPILLIGTNYSRRKRNKDSALFQTFEAI